MACCKNRKIPVQIGLYALSGTAKMYSASNQDAAERLAEGARRFAECNNCHDRTINDITVAVGDLYGEEAGLVVGERLTEEQEKH